MAINVGGKYGKKSKRYGEVINPAIIFQGMRRSGVKKPKVQRIGVGVWYGTLEPSYQYETPKKNYKEIAKRTYQDELYVETKKEALLPVAGDTAKHKVVITFNRGEVDRRIGDVNLLTRLVSYGDKMQGGTMYSNASTYEFHSGIFYATKEQVKREIEEMKRLFRQYGVTARYRIQEFRG